MLPDDEDVSWHDELSRSQDGLYDYMSREDQERFMQAFAEFGRRRTKYVEAMSALREQYTSGLPTPGGTGRRDQLVPKYALWAISMIAQQDRLGIVPREWENLARRWYSEALNQVEAGELSVWELAPFDEFFGNRSTVSGGTSELTELEKNRLGFVKHLIETGRLDPQGIE